jgi:hypothetical protein
MSRPIADDYPFDPTYGYDVDALLAIPAPQAPDDFDPPWQRLYDRARQVNVAPTVGPLEDHHDGVRIFGVSYTSVDDVRLGGWLALPDGPIACGLVIGHGYAGREAPDLPLPVSGAAAIFPCARGLRTRGRVRGIPDDTARHVLHGIGSRDRYVHRGCVADLWCAATALLELVPSRSPQPCSIPSYRHPASSRSTTRCPARATSSSLATGHVEHAGSVAQQQSLFAAQRRFLTAHLNAGRGRHERDAAGTSGTRSSSAHLTPSSPVLAATSSGPTTSSPGTRCGTRRSRAVERPQHRD